jgi:hypothetical protein
MNKKMAQLNYLVIVLNIALLFAVFGAVIISH